MIGTGCGPQRDAGGAVGAAGAAGWIVERRGVGEWEWRGTARPSRSNR
jgi:hypothetical protein